MANVTINQLTAIDDANLADELALYDISANSTKKVTISNIKGLTNSYTGGNGITITGQSIASNNSNLVNGTSTGSLKTSNATAASNSYAFAQGQNTTASGQASHAAGTSSSASGNSSYAGGTGTLAQGNSQTAIGKYNIGDQTSLFIVGNGSSTQRSNALTLDQNGNLEIAGSINDEALLNTSLNNNLLTIYNTGEYDLNNFTQNKHYWIFFEAECVLTHLPSYQNSSRGWLEILPSENNVSSSSNFIKQIWHTYNGSKYYRFKSPLGEWTLWQSSDYRFISNTIANRNLNNFTTPGKYYFEYKNGQSILNSPFNAYNGWLEVLPTFEDNVGVKQIWHRLGSQSTVGGEEGYGQEAVRLYIPTQGTTSAHWTTWKKLLVIDEDKKPFKYVTITDLSLSVIANGSSGLYIDSTHNPSIFNTKYKQDGYAPFALFYINWQGGAGNVYLQTYKINTDSFYVYIGNRSSSVQSLTNFTLGIMYYKQGLMADN